MMDEKSGITMDNSGCASAEPYALRVLGDSMEPEFPDGSIIVIDPAGTAEHGSYVIAEIESEYIFRQFIIADGRHYLKPLNPGYETIELADAAIRGIIVQQAGTRRRHHRHYV